MADQVMRARAREGTTEEQIADLLRAGKTLNAAELAFKEWAKRTYRRGSAWASTYVTTEFRGERVVLGIGHRGNATAATVGFRGGSVSRVTTHGRMVFDMGEVERFWWPHGLPVYWRQFIFSHGQMGYVMPASLGVIRDELRYVHRRMMSGGLPSDPLPVVNVNAFAAELARDRARGYVRRSDADWFALVQHERWVEEIHPVTCDLIGGGLDEFQRSSAISYLAARILNDQQVREAHRERGIT